MRRNMRKPFFQKSDNTKIPNVMFKWDTKLGACNKEPHTDTLVHTHTDITQTYTQTSTHTTTPLRHLPSVLNVKSGEIQKKRGFTARVTMTLSR